MVDKSEKFGWLVRLGFAARGVVYVLVGYIFLTTSSSSGDGGPESAFNWIQDVPGGSIVLYLCAAGLLGYGLYRLCSLAFDVENYGSDKTGIASRIGHGISGLVHFVLAYTAYQFANGEKQTASGGSTQEMASTVMSVEFGPIAIGLVGLGLFAAAFMQGKKAVTGSFMNRISARAPSFEKPLGHAGYAARSIVFAMIGWSLVQSAWFSSSDRIMTLGGAVNSLRGDSLAFTLVALGLLLFGVFSLFLARYRIIPDLDVKGRIPAFRAKLSNA